MTRTARPLLVQPAQSSSESPSLVQVAGLPCLFAGSHTCPQPAIPHVRYRDLSWEMLLVSAGFAASENVFSLSFLVHPMAVSQSSTSYFSAEDYPG